MSYVLIGGAVVFTGALSAAILPPALTGVTLLFLLLRICWLDENIKADLLDADVVPDDYRRAVREAPRLRPHEPLPDDPALLATGLRGQIQALNAAGLGALSGLVLLHAGWSTTPAMLTAMALVTLAYWQADRLITTILHLDRGEPLPPGAISRSLGWAHSWRVGGDE
jgi:hypothetical protein